MKIESTVHKMSAQPCVLMVFIEPTPYILSLLKTMKQQTFFKIDVVFLKNQVTQSWQLNLDEQDIIFPNTISKKISFFYNRFFKQRYDLIFLTGWRRSPIILSLLLATIRGIPVLVDSDTPHNPGTSFLRCVFKRILYPLLFKLPTLFLPAGTRQANYLKHYGVLESKIVIEKMTVDVLDMQKYLQALSSSFRTTLRQNLGLHENDFVILFVGRLIEDKGIRLLLKAFSMLKDVSIKLVIVGDGPLRSLVEEASLSSENICFLGFLDTEELYDIYSIANLFVLFALYEAWGLVVNLAMAAGLPVIVSQHVGCADDLVIHEKTGLVIQSLCYIELKDALLSLYNNPSLCQEMSKHTLDLISRWTLVDEVGQIHQAMCDALYEI